jgi:hypothetical protein
MDIKSASISNIVQSGVVHSHDIRGLGIEDVSEKSISGVVKIHDNANNNAEEGISGSDANPKEEYQIYPVAINRLNAVENIPTSSKSLVNYLVGTPIEVDFPDLFYRTSDEVKSQLETVFKELPSSGFLEEYKNPCWSRKEGNSDRLECLPYAYILGMPKCGTSDLFERLKAHHKVM